MATPDSGTTWQHWRKAANHRNHFPRETLTMAEADLLKPDARAALGRRERPPRLTAVVVGAGMSGLLAAIRLKRAGIDSFVVLEKSNDVGGTWLDNVYPGASCDVASHLYSYSFARNPGWSRMFAMQPEILDYFRGLARKPKLTPHLALGAEVRSADFAEGPGPRRGRTVEERKDGGRGK